MAICPQHGGYTGDGGCKKCHGKLGPIPPVDPELNRLLSATPEIDADDQLALYRLEREITAAQQKAQLAQGQFQNFVKVMFEKYGVKPAEFTLDMEKMEFTAREQK